MSGGVSGRLQQPGQHFGFRVQVIGHPVLLVVLLMAQCIVYLVPGRVLTGHNSCSGRRTYGRGGREFGEEDALGGHTVKVGCFDHGIPIAARIPKSHVVGKNKNNVWALCIVLLLSTCYYNYAG